ARQRRDDIEKAGEEFRQERYLAVLEGKEVMTGFGGEFLTSLLEKAVSAYADRLEVADDRSKTMTVLEAIAPIVEATKLEPNELGHTYCKCGSSQLELNQAECLKAAKKIGITNDGPDPTFASDEVCGACAHSVCFVENDLFIDATISQLERAGTTPRPDG